MMPEVSIGRVVTGVFPDINGGEGLTFGREKLKALIDSATEETYDI
jgi:hypothetical protein